jgi:hypothetical protein
MLAMMLAMMLAILVTAYRMMNFLSGQTDS